MAVFRRRRMKKAIIRIMTRKATAPPIMPPISAVVRPLLLLGVPEAGVLAIAVGVACTFGIKFASVLAVAVGATGVVTAWIAVVMVTACELASVVVRVEVRV
jgi:hypothetical protein